MHQYLIIQDPGHNRVYYQQASILALAELNIALTKLDVGSSDADRILLEGINYLSFKTEKELSTNDWDVISRLSFAFALFKVTEQYDTKLLLPVQKKRFEYLDSKISSVLKYPGKTNELFTRMMINVAMLTSDFDYQDNIQLLDPIAGRGTTLYEAAIYGFEAHGIEIESKSVHDAHIFFKKFLERERYKHIHKTKVLGGKGKSNQNAFHEFEFAPDKETFNEASLRKKLVMVNGNSMEANRFFKKETFHLLVGDLPYGVGHGNVAQKKQQSITRNPSELLELCLEGWYQILKKGGSLVLAWNKFVLPKEQFIELLEKYSFTVLNQEPYNSFEHRVDNAIKRDIIIAKKL